MREFVNNTDQNLIKAITQQYPTLTYNNINKLLRKKDIRVNGKKVGDNINIAAGDKVAVYYDFEKNETLIEIVYQDSNIVVVDKPQGIEVVSAQQDLVSKVSMQLGKQLYAVHRIDLNTTGLVIFATSEESKALLEEAFKNKWLDKLYITLLKGKMPKQQSVERAYLFKDVKKSQVFIYDTKKPNTKSIETHYFVKRELEDASIVEVSIPTGRTHQIRAHMSYLGHPVVGDQKYGDQQINKKYGVKKQLLCAYKIKFNFPPNHKLEYLNVAALNTFPAFIEKLI